MAGGYGRDIDDTVAIQLRTLREALLRRPPGDRWKNARPQQSDADELTPAVTPEATAAVDAAITSRRSVRAFLPTPVPRETIEEILARRLARAVGHQHAAVAACTC